MSETNPGNEVVGGTNEAVVAAAPTFGRDVQHNADQAWTSTHKKLWDQVMIGSNLNFDSIGLDDLAGQSSLVLMTEFVSRSVSNPPVSLHTKKPCNVASIVDSMTAVMRRLHLNLHNS